MSLNAFIQLASRRKKPWHGEEEVRYAWIKAIEDATGLALNAERERKDASYNHLIIEFKAPGKFNGRKDSPAFKNAINDRLLPYILKEAKKTGISESNFIGIAIDGDHIAFAQVINGEIKSQHLLPFSETSFSLVVDAFKADTRKAFSIENLLSDFGHGSSTALNLMQDMADGLNEFLSQPQNNKVSMLFEEWRNLYGQVANISGSQIEAINREIAFDWKGNLEDEISAKLFVIHTYNSFLIKILSADIVSAHNLTSFEYPAQALATISSDSELFNKLEQEIEHSELFENAQISGFIEEVIFSWYLELRHSSKITNIYKSVRSLLSKVSLYRLDHLEKTRDILRDLYQGLVPAKLRQSLGEFYTPDWLVDLTLNKIETDKLLQQRFLDPTCGSGAFLLAIIRKKRLLAHKAGWSTKQTLDNICSTVWGFDLNPLAVQTARVNFLIEIADLLKENPGYHFEVPILLADAIYSPAALPDQNKDIVEYNIGSQIANLNILLPRELALDRAQLDQVFKYMELGVEANKSFEEITTELIEYNIINDKNVNWLNPLGHTYNQVFDLHKKNWNGIWFKIVRNFFWSATAGQFDVVIGNPPWVRWSKLPELYRHRVKPTCEHYGIFSKTKRHGGNELDISAMITYTVADKWLKENATLAFVITGTLFKNPSSAGFRTFQIDGKNINSDYLQITSIDDLKNLKPFPDASNHTCIAIFTKVKSKPIYPVPYNIWEAKKGFKKAIPPNLNYKEVLQNINVSIKEAFPVGEIGSPLAVLDIGRFATISYLSNPCNWTQGRKGITTDLNGVYFIPILKVSNDKVQICSRPEAGKRDIGVSKTAWVEPTLLFPLIKGAGDFEPYYLHLDSPDYSETKLYTFIPNTAISKEAYKSSELLLNSPNLNQTFSWFSNFKPLLISRSTYKLQMKGAPFFGIYNIGDYTFKPWKVIWPEMSTTFYAAVAGSSEVPLIGKRVYIPDHKIYFASFDDKEVAYFVCGIINSPTIKEWINSHNVSIQVADIFKHLSIPEFNIHSQEHQLLAKMVESAHHTHSEVHRKTIIKDIEKLAEKIILNWSKTF
ncbi:N-6 DNA methylase [Acinetobacter baumannii]|nr:N-6 DNA methylase [Acinetobacter baumannii]